MQRFERVAGVRLVPLAGLWLAFSPASNATALLNNESAAVLEVLSGGAASSAEVAEALAQDTCLPAVEVLGILEACWRQLIDQGLVRACDTGWA